MSPLTELLRLEGKHVPGPAPSYSAAHLVLAVLAIGDAAVVGRQTLAHDLGIGEGAVRTIIKRFRQAGYLRTIPGGCTLTPRGRRLHAATRVVIPALLPIEHTDLTIGPHQAAVLVRGIGSGLGDGIRQRDEAVKVGASGATTLLIRDSRFTIPTTSADCEADYPGHVWGALRKSLRPRDGDVVILSGGQDPRLARTGAVAAALSLLAARGRAGSAWNP